MLLQILILLVVSNIVVSESVIKTLPGFSAALPFKLKTGYIGVGDLGDVQLFYYFIESERTPQVDPLLLWLAGGPGCSGLSPLLYQIGPLKFGYENYSSGDLPTLLLNPYSWTKVANIIFLDAPVGTGFSYAQTSQGYKTGDSLSTLQTYDFLRKWLVAHPMFLTNPLYIGGDSYAGQTVPLLFQEIFNSNEVGHEPLVNLKGYMLGNPSTDVSIDLNSRIDFAHEKALISDELYESIRKNCNGEYVRVDTSNVLCVSALQVFSKALENLNTEQVLEPKCTIPNLEPIGFNRKTQKNLQSLENLFTEHILEPKCTSSLSLEPTGSKWETPEINEPRCRVYYYLLSYVWANDKSVQNALQVQEGVIKEWVRCNWYLPYTQDAISRVDYHRNFTNKGYQALVYSGDHDILLPYVGTCNWIKSLNLTIVDEWQPWFVEGQIAGYKISYSKNEYSLTFATVKGAGHTAPEYKGEECLAMIDRWFSHHPL